ncbi:MAG: PHP domain-containing protein [Clostridia bacterium]|nr:PHP domain-containing protein [Clostridia bacterium]
MPADLHCHTRLSDGSLGIEDLILLAKRSGVDTIAITDHDCLAGTVRGKIIGERHGITVVPGVEISAFDAEHEKKVHILCYLVENPDRLEGLCRRNSLARRKASQLMVVKAAQRYPISSELVLKCAAGSTNIYKQHILHALMECGYSTEIFGNMYTDLFSKDNPDNIIVQPKFPEPLEVLEAIHEAGGIAVLAHPGAYDNFDILPALIEKGLDGVEVWHPRNSEEDVEKLLAIAKKHSLLTTGGSDFHGMYGSKINHLADYVTPEENLTALMGYQAKQRRARKKAAAKEAAKESEK